MPEYAVLDDRGEVLSLVTTTEPVKELFVKLLDPETGDFAGQIKLIEDVPPEKLQRYRDLSEHL